MTQMRFFDRVAPGDAENAGKPKRTHSEVLLAKMDKVVL